MNTPQSKEYLTTDPVRYDNETDYWDQQPPIPDLVAQLDPVAMPEHPLPVPDNTIKTLFYWAMDLDITQGARMVLLSIIRHVQWVDGTGCTASIPTLAREAHQTKKTTIGHIKALIDAGLISRKRRMSKASETVLTTAQLASELPCTVSVETTLTVQGNGNASNQYSSSTNPSNQSVKSARSAKAKAKKGPETKDHGNTKKTLEEEGATGTTVETSPSEPEPNITPEEANAWLDISLSEIPMDSGIEYVGQHCWPTWGPHWGGGWAAAWSTWTKDTPSRKKFRKDAVAQFVKVGLPKPVPPDPDNELARQRSSEQLDKRIAEAPARVVRKSCAGCGQHRELSPGVTHCYLCRKALVGV